MKIRSLRKYLDDILSASEKIELIATGIKLQDLQDDKLRWSLERGISIIGEALYQASRIEKNLSITNLNRIIATRHIIIHDCDIVDKERILSIVKSHLPILKSETFQIINSLSPEI